MTEYIERDMLCRVLERYRKAPKNRYQRGVEDGMELALNAIKAIHAADVAPVAHGRWEWFDEETGTPFTGYEREWGWKCSYCGEELPDDYDGLAQCDALDEPILWRLTAQHPFKRQAVARFALQAVRRSDRQLTLRDLLGIESPPKARRAPVRARVYF